MAAPPPPPLPSPAVPPIEAANPSTTSAISIPSLAPISSQAKASYATILANAQPCPASNNSSLSKKGDIMCVKIDESIYQQRVAMCKDSMIGRLILSKGDQPWKIVDLKKRLQEIWKPTESWRIVSLGRGFYNIHFSNPEDRNRVWQAASWSIKPGILRLQPWTPDFNPFNQRPTNAQVWVRIHDLSWEYWHPQILSDIAKCVGHPLKIDNASIQGDLGHYARVLVDIDLSKSLIYSVMIEREGYEFFVSFTYENLPEFCSNCSSVGHSIGSCRRLPSQTPKQSAEISKAYKPNCQEFRIKSTHVEPNKEAPSNPSDIANATAPVIPASSNTAQATNTTDYVTKDPIENVVSRDFDAPELDNSAALSPITVPPDDPQIFHPKNTCSSVVLLTSPSRALPCTEIVEPTHAMNKSVVNDSQADVHILNPDGINLSIELPPSAIQEYNKAIQVARSVPEASQ